MVASPCGSCRPAPVSHSTALSIIPASFQAHPTARIRTQRQPRTQPRTCVASMNVHLASTITLDRSETVAGHQSQYAARFPPPSGMAPLVAVGCAAASHIGNASSTQQSLVLLSPPSNSNPDEHDDNVHSLALSAFILESPHAVLLLFPIGPRGTMHPPPPHMWFCFRLRRFCAGRDMRLFRLRFGTPTRLAHCRRRYQMLDNGAVAGELKGS